MQRWTAMRRSRVSSTPSSMRKVSAPAGLWWMLQSLSFTWLRPHCHISILLAQVQHCCACCARTFSTMHSQHHGCGGGSCWRQPQARLWPHWQTAIQQQPGAAAGCCRVQRQAAATAAGMTMSCPVCGSTWQPISLGARRPPTCGMRSARHQVCIVD